MTTLYLVTVNNHAPHVFKSLNNALDRFYTYVYANENYCHVSTIDPDQIEDNLNEYDIATYKYRFYTVKIEKGYLEED